jgi:hypothetical protein
MPPGTGFGLRSPQVPVNGSGLQSLLNSNGENINVLQDQVDAELFRPQVPGVTFTLQFELGRTDGSSLGIYDGHLAVPTLMELFPAGSSSGWFAVASFRSGPTRVVVNVLDQNAALRHTMTYLGGDRFGTGLYVSGPGGTLYSQDARNPGGSPRWLYFAGTGVNSGSWWLAAEDGALASGPDAGFDDVVCFLETISDGFYVTPVMRTNWGRLKARFR